VAEYRLLITDLTDFGALRCVAGWDIDRARMIRPEPRPAAFWPSELTGANQPFFPGNIVRFSADPPNPPTDLPHLNEDRVVEGGIVLERRLSSPEFTNALNLIGAIPEVVVFGPPAQFSNNKAFIETNTNHPSLVGTEVAVDAIRFFEENFRGKRRPRCRLLMPDKMVNLSIASNQVRELFYAQGIAAVEASFANVARLHLRVGLARGFGEYPNRCYMQINGIYKL
jgi:hypothetical protein